jgi:hypothetical protein
MEHHTMKHFSFAIFSALLLTAISCTQPPPPAPTQALLLELQSPNCSSVEGFLTYENDSIQVVYVFWAENGLVGLFIHNKLKQPLYIDWKKCSYITGTTKHDYWDETITMATNGSSTTSASYWKMFYDRSHTTATEYNSAFSNTFWSSVTTITKPEKITFIPPGTTISRTFNSISENPIGQLDREHLLSKDTTFQNMQVKITRLVKYEGTTYQEDSLAAGPFKVHLSFIRYNIENSPLSFRLFMTYSTNDKFNSEAFIDNQFYVNQITQIPLSSFNAKKTDSDDNCNIWATPNSFYVFKTPNNNSPTYVAP